MRLFLDEFVSHIAKNPIDDTFLHGYNRSSYVNLWKNGLHEKVERYKG